MRTVNPEEHARKRARIIEAAAVEIAAHGVAGTSTAKICRRAGIGSGTLFHYFATKRDIVHALFGDDLDDNAAARSHALGRARPEESLDLLVAHLLDDLDNPLVPGLMAAALVQVHTDHEFATMLGADEKQTFDALITVLQRMEANGCRLRFPPRSVALWITRTADAILLSAEGEDFDPARQSAELREIVNWLTGRVDLFLHHGVEFGDGAPVANGHRCAGVLFQIGGGDFGASLAVGIVDVQPVASGHDLLRPAFA